MNKDLMLKKFELEGFQKAQVDLYRDNFAKDASDEELFFFMQVCKQMNLDPVKRQIYLVPRWDKKLNKNLFIPQVSVDGLRAIAERSGGYEGQAGPFWCGEDGRWVDVWTKQTPPLASKVGVHKKGCREPIWGVAKYDAYVQKYYDKGEGKWKVSPMWLKMPDNQLAKCAESLALRKAFPNEAGGHYTKEEMEQADQDSPTTVMVSPQAPKASIPTTLPTTPSKLSERIKKAKEEIKEIKEEKVIEATGEILKEPPKEIDSNEPLPNFDGFDKAMQPPKNHWTQIATAGSLAGKTFKQILDEQGKEKFLKLYEASIKSIARMQQEGKAIPQSTQETFKALESCCEELT